MKTQEQTDWHHEFSEILGRKPTKEDEDSLYSLLPSPIDERCALNRTIDDLAGADKKGVLAAMKAAREDVTRRKGMAAREEREKKERASAFWRGVRNMVVLCMFVGVFAGSGVAAYMATREPAFKALMSYYGNVEEYKAGVETELDNRKTALEVAYKEKMIALSGEGEKSIVDDIVGSMEVHPASWRKDDKYTRGRYTNGSINLGFDDSNIVKIYEPFERTLSFESSQRVASALIKAKVEK